MIRVRFPVRALRESGTEYQRRPHKPEIAGSTPVPATKCIRKTRRIGFSGFFVCGISFLSRICARFLVFRILLEPSFVFFILVEVGRHNPLKSEGLGLPYLFAVGVEALHHGSCSCTTLITGEFDMGEADVWNTEHLMFKYNFLHKNNRNKRHKGGKHG